MTFDRLDQKTKMRLVGQEASRFAKDHEAEYKVLYRYFKAIGKIGESNPYYRQRAINALKKMYPVEWNRRYSEALKR